MGLTFTKRELALVVESLYQYQMKLSQETPERKKCGSPTRAQREQREVFVKMVVAQARADREGE